MTKNCGESRKEWVAPELKKIGIEEITAGNGGTSTDGFGGHHSKVASGNDGSGHNFS